MNKNQVAPPLLEYLIAHQGETLEVTRLALAVGMTEKQVKGGMYRIARTGKWPLEVISQGHMWTVGVAAGTPDPHPVDDGTVAFDLIDDLGGHLILRDGDGGLYVARRIGISEG